LRAQRGNSAGGVFNGERQIAMMDCRAALAMTAFFKGYAPYQ
jgi:hypothetical protein